MVEQGSISPKLGMAGTAIEQKTEPAKNSLFKSIIFRSRSPANKKVAFCLPPAETPSSSAEHPPAPSKIIECFCSAIRNRTKICTCIGILLGKNIKHPVWVPSAPLTSATVVPLAKLLSLPAPHMRERLKLAVRLASSVLQFHTSGWLQERWDKNDIFLVQRDSSQPSLETPVVHHDFTPEPSSPTKPSLVFCNLSLFSLGIVLIELWFWKHVESFQADTPKAEDPDTTIFTTALRLVERLDQLAGAKYSNSVRRCIRGLDHPEPRLENNEFKNEVHLKVLQPLEKHLEDFCDKSLWEIFPALSLSFPSSAQAYHQLLGK